MFRPQGILSRGGDPIGKRETGAPHRLVRLDSRADASSSGAFHEAGNAAVAICRPGTAAERAGRRHRARPRAHRGGNSTSSGLAFMNPEAAKRLRLLASAVSAILVLCVLAAGW